MICVVFVAESLPTFGPLLDLVGKLSTCSIVTGKPSNHKAFSLIVSHRQAHSLTSLAICPLIGLFWVSALWSGVMTKNGCFFHKHNDCELELAILRLRPINILLKSELDSSRKQKKQDYFLALQVISLIASIEGVKN